MSQNQNIESEENIKELLFSGGAGCIGFMMGYLHGLIEIVGKETLKQYKLGGVSAGNAAALFFHMTLHQDEYDMKYFHQKEISKYFAKENKKFFGLFTNYKVINENTMTYCEKLQKFGDQIPNINGIFHSVVTEWQGGLKFKKVVIDQFDSNDDLSKVIQSSCQIPFFTAPKIFQKRQGKYLLDGGFRGSVPYKYENSQKIFINMLPKVTSLLTDIKNKPKNCTTLNITDGHGIYFPRDYYVWSEDWNDNMFLKGYLSAKRSIENIRDAFGLYEKEEAENKPEPQIYQFQQQEMVFKPENDQEDIIDQLNNMEIVKTYDQQEEEEQQQQNEIILSQEQQEQLDYVLNNNNEVNNCSPEKKRKSSFEQMLENDPLLNNKIQIF